MKDRSELDLARAGVLTDDQAASEELWSRIARCVNFVLNQYGWFTIVSADMRHDMVQESLLRLIDRVQRGFDGVDRQFKTYVYKVVYSVTSSEVKRTQRSISLDQEVSRPDGSPVPLRDLIAQEIMPWLGVAIEPSDPAEAMAQAERARRVAEALRALSPRDREVLRLFEVEGLSTREIAQRMGMTEANVSVRLHRAKERLFKEYIRTFAPTPSGVDDAWISFLIEKLPQDEAAVLQIWWKEGSSVREIARRLGIPEDRCRDLLDRGKANLSRLAEESPDAS